MKLSCSKGPIRVMAGAQPRVGLGILMVFVLVGTAVGQIPPGYKVVHVTDTPEYDRWPRLNNRGQIVFYTRFDINEHDSEEIFLYENGQLTRLTNDKISDSFPDINDDGVIVWSRAIGPDDTLEIVRYENGQLTQITNDALSDYAPHINNLGNISWSAWNGTGCSNAGSEVRFFDGATIHDITANGSSNQADRLNDLDEVIWTRFDLCVDPWESDVMLYSKGVTTELTDFQFEPNGVSINNLSQVGWLHRVPLDYHHEVQTWQDGVTTTLTNWGSGVYLNNAGQIALDRWHDDTQVWQVWLVSNGEVRRLTDEPVWNFYGDINDRGEVVWERGLYPDGDIRHMKRLPLGDLNCDDQVDFLDVDPFVSALIDPAGYVEQYATCDRQLADTNADGSVNSFDIDSFLELLP